MRSIDSGTLTAAKNLIQTKATKSDPRLSLWIGRPVTQLTGTQFLETLDVTGITGITDCDIAVRHTTYGRGGDGVYLAYIKDGYAHVISSQSYVVMSRHTFIDTGFSETADHVAIAFDGTMPKNVSGKYEFLTEKQPWVFWTASGVLYARKLGTTDTITLASANCTWVDAIRATWSEIPAFDFGLCVFFIISGAVYYRQLIGGVWYDAEAIPSSALPTVDSGVTWTQVSCSRTWDWRIALQLKASDGKMYECFTQFMGIGSKSAEHIEIKSVKVTGAMAEVHYSDTSAGEHIEVCDITADGTLRRNISPVPSTVANINDGAGQWNMLVEVTLDNPCDSESVSGNYSAFSMIDTSSHTYACSAASCSADGLKITLTFESFLSASGNLTLSYTPGTITSPDLEMVAWSFAFTPTHLTKPDGYSLEHIEISNISAIGTLSAITYTNAYNGGEHLEIASITAVGTLTNVSDI